jgi:hypothetical protein
MTLLEQAFDADGKIILAQASTVCRSSFKSANGGDCRAGRPTSVALSCGDGNFHIRRRIGGDIEQIINRCHPNREDIVLLGHWRILVLFFMGCIGPVSEVLDILRHILIDQFPVSDGKTSNDNNDEYRGSSLRSE